MNGTANGYPIRHAKIRNAVSRVSIGSVQVEAKNVYTVSADRPLFADCFLAEARPHPFVIPPPYLAASNGDEQENHEWKLIDEKKNTTNDDDNVDDAVQKRIVPFVYLSIYRRHLFLYSYVSLTGLVVSICTVIGDPCRRNVFYPSHPENHSAINAIIPILFFFP